jgi:phage repressor protein C with HTH and peptisase S24 domain
MIQLDMTMLSHERIWAVIDRLAERNALSASALAKKAGLDPTTFNKSKRTSADGRPRWPSTESLAKIMEATGSNIDELFQMLSTSPLTYRMPEAKSTIPLLGFAEAGQGGYFDDAGFPEGHGWDEIQFPATVSENLLALEVSGESMMPLYRNGDTLIVDRAAQLRKGDRVVLRTTNGEVMAKILVRQTNKQVDLHSLNPEHANRTIETANVDWIGRIMWASQ